MASIILITGITRPVSRAISFLMRLTRGTRSEPLFSSTKGIRPYPNCKDKSSYGLTALVSSVSVFAAFSDAAWASLAACSF